MMPPRILLPRLVACLLLALLAGCSAGGDNGGDGGAVPAWARGMRVAEVSELPVEARRTLRLTDEGGPFPHERDGSVFGNFEGLLPRHERGYYREYTVPTPGSDDRGARRIVTGRNGETYYTDDHYASFTAVPR
ncbi:ribonuclease domain-containing protein [Streptomyces pseudogriseolus]|uniref:ribonuclease domain-containing protein n=1 Tax=Streptomyces pseudogriseolus TaxID=36817 RepID=UPI001CE29CC2|nr:ribonuclease domain-containing protein [Streptomyces pseudogriseolus]